LITGKEIGSFTADQLATTGIPVTLDKRETWIFEMTPQ
jgi:hypothetical protein